MTESKSLSEASISSERIDRGCWRSNKIVYANMVVNFRLNCFWSMLIAGMISDTISLPYDESKFDP